MSNNFSNILITWYNENARNLPWRNTKDPYKVWLSEIILQQTRVNQGLPYYNKIINTYPTIYDLAKTSIDELLRLWQGLGYYSRARNMYACAQEIVSKYDGKFPISFKELLDLKGIGKYTAAAIASICFDEPVPVVDGNVFRFVSRHFMIDADISKSSSYHRFFDHLKKIIPPSNPGVFNQAMMEMGATICLPKKPLCHNCNFSITCKGKKENKILYLPVNNKKIKTKIRHFDYYCFLDIDGIWLRKREKNDIWKGLYEFYLIESSKFESGLTHVYDFFDTTKIKNRIQFRHTESYTHLLTHQKLKINIHLLEGEYPLEKYPPHGFKKIVFSEIKHFPLPIILSNYLKKNIPQYFEIEKPINDSQF